MSEITIKNTIVLVELQDGSIHQVAVKEKNRMQLLRLIVQLEGSINVLETPIEGLYIQESIKKEIKNKNEKIRTKTGS